jgi:hypothetical protein
MSARPMTDDDRERDPWPPMSTELKAFEAELATLLPRTEQLDRDRILFLSGQASVASKRNRTNLAWPAGFFGMSAVAATLLMVVVSGLSAPDQTSSPEARQLSIASQTPHDVATTQSRFPTSPQSHDVDTVDTDLSRNRLAEAASAGTKIQLRAVYLEACSWMVSQGVDPWKMPVGTTQPSDKLEEDHPVTYQHFRDSMLQDLDKQI